MKKNKKREILTGICIEDIGAEGKAVARVNNVVLFVPYGIPGDVCDVEMIKKRKQYMEGRIVALATPSPLRISPACEHFGLCGGCRWQHLPYSEQLRYKQKQVKDAFEHIGKLDTGHWNNILPSEKIWAYRNKLEFTFSDAGWLTREEIENGNTVHPPQALGFHIPEKFDKVLDIRKCHLQPEPSNHIRLALKEYALKNNLTFFNLREKRGMMRNLILRNNLKGEFMVIVIFGENKQDIINKTLKHLRDTFPEICSLYYAINTKVNDAIYDLPIVHYSGATHLMETMEDLSFRIGPKSFYQTNSLQALRLYNKIKEMAQLQGHETVYDLYTGTGTIALFLARHCRQVAGIESVPEAVEDARANAAINQIENVVFVAGDMKDTLTPEFVAKHGKPHVVCIDPPRAGMHEKVIRTIQLMSPEKIIYVSCNPATQARDLNLLQDMYRIETIQPVDMFPHTAHVENIAMAVLKKPLCL